MLLKNYNPEPTLHLVKSKSGKITIEHTKKCYELAKLVHAEIYIEKRLIY